MIKLILLIFTLLFLSNCSISENSRIWTDKEEKLENQKNTKKLFAKEEKIITELNPELKLDFSKLKLNSYIIDNKNNFGAQNYRGINQKKALINFLKLKIPII